MAESRGVPEEVRRLAAEMFQGVEVQVETQWGLTRPLAIRREVPQGSVSGPESSKPAQDPILRLRELRPAHYTIYILAER